jgi:hypothetical protein
MVIEGVLMNMRRFISILIAALALLAAFGACTNPVVENSEDTDGTLSVRTYTATDGAKGYTLVISHAGDGVAHEVGDDYELTVTNGVSTKKSAGKVASVDTNSYMQSCRLQPQYTGAEAFSVILYVSGINGINGNITFIDGSIEPGPGYVGSGVYTGGGIGGGGGIGAGDSNVKITAPATPVKNGTIVISADGGGTKTLTYNDSSSAAFAFTVIGAGNTATATVTKKNNAAFTETLEIPALFKVGDNYYPVASIADSAFVGVTAITTLVIPSTVMNIGDNAFDSCTSLVNVIIEDADSAGNARIVATIPTGTRSIGNDAFADCISLTTIIIYARTPPALGRNGLPDGDTLTSIFVPAASVDAYKAAPGWNRYAAIIKAIGSEDIHVHVWGAWVESEDGGNHLITRTCSFGRPSHSETYTFYDLSRDTGIGFSIDDSKGTVSVSSADNDIQYISIPEYYKENGAYYRVTSINDFAFWSREDIISVTIPEGVTYIGHHAFGNCNSLADINIPEGVTSIGEQTFLGCLGLTDITIPASATSIGNQAFSSCYDLASIIFVEGSRLMSIGDQAFDACYALTNIAIPASVTSIGDGTFFWCYSLTAITVDTGNPNYISIDGVLYNKAKTRLMVYPASKGDESFTIPESVTSIDDYLFRQCFNLTSITIPAGVTSIGEGVFKDCRSLTSVIFAEGSLLTSIGISAFVGCPFTSITIPAGVTSIDYAAFQGCISLSSVIIPTSVTTIGIWAFSYCTTLASVTIGAGVTSIGTLAFDGCTGLASVTFEGTIPSGSFSSTSIFPGDLRDVFYATDTANGTPGTYTRTPPATTWTL